MRLLDTTTLELHEFYQPPKRYAILSHTWGEEEVDLQQLLTSNGPKLKGWTKLTQFCQRAAEDGWRYGWMDTCCIDRTSSAELSEAINSMWSWYSRASMCYAHLDDVKMEDGCPVPQLQLCGPEIEYFAQVRDRPGFQQLYSQFEERSYDGNAAQHSRVVVRYTQGIVSRYFRRGWTLQELLAPQQLLFVDQVWNTIGSRSELATDIYALTGIRGVYLTGRYGRVRGSTLALRRALAWSASRETTRPEDGAYALLGLLGASMPLLYGEGALKAYRRLMIEVLRTANDEVLPTWRL